MQVAHADGFTRARLQRVEFRFPVDCAGSSDTTSFAMEAHDCNLVDHMIGEPLYATMTPVVLRRDSYDAAKSLSANTATRSRNAPRAERDYVVDGAGEGTPRFA